MADNPLVSIGMPVYNGAEYVHQALNSLLAQDHDNFELIISDNASTDDTWGILLDYATRDRRITLHRQAANIGPVANFSFVLDQARSNYFMWSAHDDWWEPTFISELLQPLVQDKEMVVASCQFDKVDPRTGRVVTELREPPYFKAGASFVGNQVTFLANPCPWMIYGLCRREVVRAVFPKQPGKSFDFYDIYHTFCLLERGKPVVIRKKLYHVGKAKSHNETSRLSRPSILGTQFDYLEFHAAMTRRIASNPQATLWQKVLLWCLLNRYIARLTRFHDPWTIARLLWSPFDILSGIRPRWISHVVHRGGNFG